MRMAPDDSNTDFIVPACDLGLSNYAGLVLIWQPIPTHDTIAADGNRIVHRTGRHLMILTKHYTAAGWMGSP